MRYSRFLYVFVIVSITLVGCRAEKMPTQSTATMAASPTQLAGGSSPLESPLASPLSPPDTGVFIPTPVPEPASGMGTLTGRLVDYLTGMPASEMAIYLGQLSAMDMGGTESHLVIMQPSSSPQTSIDRHGHFAFVDVEPGIYALVIWTPVNSWVVSDPATSKDVLVTIEADKITELGEIATDLPG